MKTTGRETINRVLAEEIERDDRVVVLGENVRLAGALGATAGLYDRFGPAVIHETPVSENAILGAALGLALDGFRPVVEIFSADFLLAVANEVVNDIPKWRQQHALAGGLPIVIRGCMGANGGLGPEHSQCVEPYFHHAPGLTVVTPGSVAALGGLLRASVRSDDPVLFLEHRKLYDQSAEVADPAAVTPVGVAETVRDGTDVTVVAWGWMRQEAEAACGRLADEGVSCALIDPRTISPMDFPAIVESVSRTGRLLVVEESPITGSVAAEVLARVLEAGVSVHAARRLAMPDVIHPYSAALERPLIPDAEAIVSAARALIDGGTR
jgi:pyruvate dehydrogenase E1 component beta subunit